MKSDDHFEYLSGETAMDFAAEKSRPDRSYLVDLIGVLRSHPAGLRRWSVMRAIRSKRENSGHEVSQKFEDEVERTFRKMCAGMDPIKNTKDSQSSALFYKPQDRAGEVWAVFPDKAEAWLRTEHAEND
jgi:hypothetical protein